MTKNKGTVEKCPPAYRDPIYFLDSVTPLEEPREQCTVVFVITLFYTKPR